MTRTRTMIKFYGEVTNQSARPIADLRVDMLLRAEDGTLIKVESTAVDFSPVLPGQTATFRGYDAEDNPRSAHCEIGFHQSPRTPVAFDAVHRQRPIEAR